MNIVMARILPHAERVMEVPTNTVREILLQGIGVAFLTRSLIAEELKIGSIVEIEVHDLPQVFRENVLVHPARTSIQAAALTDFIYTFQDEAARHYIVDHHAR